MKKSPFFLLLCLALSQAPLFAAGEKIVVAQMAGQPQIVRGNQMIPAKIGMECRTGDILKTPAAGCRMDVALNDLAGCRVLPASECVIVQGSSSGMRIQIKNGNAILNLKKLPVNSTFEVETPTAVATVRGTQFWGRVEAGQADNPVTTFAVREGMVKIFDKKTAKIFSLKKGQALDIPKNAAVAPTVRPALEAELKALEQAPSIRTSA